MPYLGVIYFSDCNGEAEIWIWTEYVHSLKPNMCSTGHNCKGVHGKYPLLQDGFLVVAICCWLVALCWNVISCDLESFPNCISKENLVLSSAGFEYYSQEFRDRAYVWRLITLVWELLSGQTGAFLKSSGPQLSVENKNSWILYRHHWENRIWREQT